MIKYRKAYFSVLLASDYAKLNYLEFLVNSITAWFIDVFLQDVMDMTTRDWLRLPVAVFIALPLFPFFSLYELSKVRKNASKYPKDSGSFVSYDGIYIYWRDTSDFVTQPQSYLQK